EDDSFARYAAAAALNRIVRADPAASRAIVGSLSHAKMSIRSGVRMALRATYEEPLVRALADFARDPAGTPGARAEAIGLLAEVPRRRPAWRGEWWAYPPALAPPPARTETWRGTTIVLDTLRDRLDDADPRVRLASVEGLRE